MTKKYYVVATIESATIHMNGRSSQTTDPGTASPVTVGVTVPGSADNYLAFVFYTPSGEPNSADWPVASPGDPYLAQCEVSVAGADLTYGIGSAVSGHFARVNTGLSSDLEVIVSAGIATVTGTGLKTFTSEFANPAAGSAGDRFEVLLGVDNANMMSQNLNIEINTSNTFLQGPWVDAPPAGDTPGPAYVGGGYYG